MIALFAETPALPLHTAGPYVAAAYIVFLLIVLIYVGIMATRLTRNGRELRELRRELEERRRAQESDTQAGGAQDNGAQGGAVKESEPVA